MSTTSSSNIRYFYDSYAVIEYLKGNENYRHYFDDANGILTKLNLMEVYFKLLSTADSRTAKEALTSFSKYLVDFDLHNIEEAMKLRLNFKQNRRQEISYADALGYHLAKQNGTKFLTGDNEFRGLDNVEFVG